MPTQRFMSVNDARSLGDSQTDLQCKILVSLITKVQKRIQYQCEILHKCDLIWHCPQFLPDLPRFDYIDMCRQLCNHLVRQKFFVRRFNKSSLYISWRKTLPTTRIAP